MRVFLIVLDSFGIGAAPDAELFGDAGKNGSPPSNTLASICTSNKFHADNLAKLGLFKIDGISDDIYKSDSVPLGKYARLRELSAGKDTVIGHWEIAGIVSKRPMPTYPNGFPNELIKRFESETGHKVLCNKPYSGTQVIADYGKQAIEENALIVYTSADSVFQVAAHEDIIPVPELYKYCDIARKMLVGEHGVGRVIARPFIGKYPNYVRTSNRHDFALTPPEDTLLDEIKSRGFEVIAVGKISDIFAGRGITQAIKTKNNSDGMRVTSEIQGREFEGLCFVNLVDFDMLYGHRNDTHGYAGAISEFDNWLGGFIEKMSKDDTLIITADHGCDPAYPTTDHTREYVPMLMFRHGIISENLGTIDGFTFVSDTIKSILQK